MTVSELLDTLGRRALDQHESYTTFTNLVDGRLSDIEIAALLAAMKTRGESPSEIAGAARALREHAVRFPAPEEPVADTCGTGGDGAGTINVSTAAAFVAAAAGVLVAKHGNRASSSACGSADLLEACGARLDPPPAGARRCLDRTGICFLYAPAYHPGVRRAMGVRRALGTRTLFNIVGPLANPARPALQVLGVYAPELVRPAAETLALLGCRAALVVHGSGLDEIALHGPTTAARVSAGGIEEIELTPDEAGVRPEPLATLRGPALSGAAEWLHGLLAGAGTRAHTSAVAVNAGALLWIADHAATLAAGTALALDVLRSGRAAPVLHQFIEATHDA